ncbi:unnamed protein product [Blepharisma stoltei]|uniref:Uncharacterized protein n=1 Tax=Blepharisma stoltei TaxID=1481888 RepID=A0AAU9JEJ1_9CILI|nr:unnamed protein product [Blepharisma stoltei]
MNPLESTCIKIVKISNWYSASRISFENQRIPKISSNQLTIGITILVISNWKLIPWIFQKKAKILQIFIRNIHWCDFSLELIIKIRRISNSDNSDAKIWVNCISLFLNKFRGIIIVHKYQKIIFFPSQPCSFPYWKSNHISLINF